MDLQAEITKRETYLMLHTPPLTITAIQVQATSDNLSDELYIDYLDNIIASL